MKIIFLDIDGVLSTHKTSDNYEEEKFDDKACKNLKKIIDITGCKLVLTSSWRLYANYISLMFQLLKPYEITKNDFLGKTRFLDSRAKEINDYLKRHTKITNYVVLDDEPILSSLIPSDRIIKTQSQYGITAKILEKCIEKLQ